MPFELHGFSRKIEDNEGLWRYMNFSQFVSLIIKSQLFFTRMPFLGDEMEGTWSNTMELTYLNFNKTFARAGIDKLRDFTSSLKDRICVNCWHINNFESAAMWNSYLKTNEGLAIKTDFKRIKEVFEKIDHVGGGTMIYRDYQSDELIPNFLFPLITKQISYQYEQEFRLQTMLDGPEILDNAFQFGKFIDVDIVKLIDKVYISPNSPQWFKDLINEFILKIGYNFEIVDSSLKDRSLK